MSARTEPTHHLAYVLHRRAYRETSAILELFVESEGRVAAVARGLQAGRSAMAALCQPMQELRVAWTGRSALKTLVRAERNAAPVQLEGERLFSMLYCNELLCRLLAHNDPHPRLFEAYRDLLRNIADSQDLEAMLRQFELVLLEELGYALELDREAMTGAPLDPHARYRYVPEQGLRASAVGEEDGVYRGAELLSMHAGRFDDQRTRRTAKLLLREVLQALLGPRPLASRELFRRRPE